MTIHSPFKPFKLTPCQFVLVDPPLNPALDFITSLLNGAIVPANKDPVRENDMQALRSMRGGRSGAALSHVARDHQPSPNPPLTLP